MRAARRMDMCFGLCIGHYPPHPTIGYIIQGSNNVITENMAQSRRFDMVTAGCGIGKGFIIMASGTVMVNNRGAARVLDRFVGTYIGFIIRGAQKTDIGG